MVTMDAPRGDQVARGGERSAAGGTSSRPSVASAWRPLAGPALLERLRHTGRARPPADPTAAAELRSFVERGLAGMPLTSSGSGSKAEPPLVVTKDRLSRGLACASHRSAREFGGRPFTRPLACGALVDVLFRQLVTVGSIGEAMTDAMDGLALDDHQALLLSWIRELPRAELAELGAEVDRQADGLRTRWPALDPSWLPRTQEVLRVPLAGGRVELSARVDLAIGRTDEDVASVALVEVKSGARRPGHRADLHFYALVEALRSGNPPFAVAVYYARTGELDVEPVTLELLADAARRCLSGIRAMAAADCDGDPAASARYCAACLEHPLQGLPSVGSGPDAAAAAVADAGAPGPDTVVPFPHERAA
ncbi:MAG: PD-(D/E)XK nuclease family protein [Acidimicrobiales bacterium]